MLVAALIVVRDDAGSACTPAARCRRSGGERTRAALRDRLRCGSRSCCRGRASAHVGSPDVFLDGQAGPYRVLVTVRPPHAIPGVADVEVLTTATTCAKCASCRCRSPAPARSSRRCRIVATRSRRRSAAVHRSSVDDGRRRLAGARHGRRAIAATGSLSVPVPTLPQATLAMSPALRALLVAFMLSCCAPASSRSSSAMAREARLDAGRSARRARAPPRTDRRRDRGRRRRRRRRISATGGGRVEASSYARYVYKPLEAHADGRGRWTPRRSTLRDPGWIRLARARRLRPRSRSSDAPVRRVARARSALASASGRSGAPARSSSGCPTCRRATTSCSRISCTPPACRKP